MKNKKKLILRAVIAVAVFGTAASVVMRKKETVVYESRPTVSVEYPQTGDITLYTELTGVIEPESKAAVQPKMAGEVLEVYFQAGNTVQVGQALLKIDSDALTTLQLQVDAAAVSMKDANTNLGRIRELFEQEFVSQQDMEKAESAAENARIAYEKAQDQYTLQLQYTTVTAPINGIVESRMVEPHDHVSTSASVCVIAGNEEIHVNFGVTGKMLENLSVGEPVSIEKNGTEYQGSVSEINTMVNEKTGLYDIKAVIPQSEGLTTGARVKLTAVMERAGQVMTVPIDAVSYRDGVPFVYCYDNGIAAETMIESGIYDSEKMEVKSGLTDESMVITSWSNELIDQEEVLLEEGQVEIDG